LSLRNFISDNNSSCGNSHFSLQLIFLALYTILFLGKHRWKHRDGSYASELWKHRDGSYASELWKHRDGSYASELEAREPSPCFTLLL